MGVVKTMTWSLARTWLKGRALVERSWHWLSVIHRRLVFRFCPISEEQRNIWLLYADIAFQGIVAGGAAAYLAVFAVRLGASTYLVSLLTSLPSLLTAVAAIPAGRIVARQRRLVTTVAKARVGFRVAYLLVALVPWLAPTWAPQAIVAIWAMAAIPSSFAMISFTTSMAEIIPVRRRAAVVSTRYAIHACVSAAVLPFTGKLLESLPFPTGYQVVFAISFLAGMLSVLTFSRIRIPDQTLRPMDDEDVGFAERLLGAWRDLRAHPRFTGYLLSATLFRLGMNLPLALFSVFWVNYLHLTDGNIALATMLNNLTLVIGYFVWGSVASRRGHGPVLVCSTIGLAAYPVLTAFAHSLTPILFAALVGGLFSAGLNLAFFNVLLALAPADRRSAYVALNSVSANGMSFLGPILGSVVADVLGIRPAFLLAGAVRLLGGLLFAVKRVRD